MFPAVIRHQLLKPSVTSVNQLARASVHGKAHTDMKGTEDFYVNTTFPDDYEASSAALDAELLKRQAEAEASNGPWDEATIEQHRKDIYESIYPQQGGNKKRADNPPDPERAPDMDEM
ncbi:hypothetical protein N7478_000622 [Penicillium angulare]|uniref:uncharacterized protein n=1 Tax=Penicillium angulare TaxID=116970 RepID=UPI0025410FF4|nr:uncharacterized protein N7478_000622 [Penicillium angulare]KAJ5291371.1 hypothetical protein N7478_000622 [Penicillium angulare]